MSVAWPASWAPSPPAGSPTGAGGKTCAQADAILNLPEELHSHGLRELAAVESTRGSFEEARDAIRRARRSQ